MANDMVAKSKATIAILVSHLMDDNIAIMAKSFIKQFIVSECLNFVMPNFVKLEMFKIVVYLILEMLYSIMKSVLQDG